MGVQIKVTVSCLGQTGTSTPPLAVFSSSLRVFVEHGVRDSWGLVQGMMTEQDSLSSPVHIPVACLPLPSAHLLHPPASLTPSHPICLLILTTSPPALVSSKTLAPSSAWGTASSSILPFPGEGSTHGIIPRLPKGETEAREVGGERGRQRS